MELAAPSPTDRRRIGRRPSAQRSKIGNGSALLPSSDGRSVWARLVKETLCALQQHCGGELSETQKLMARRVAVLESELIFLEDGFARARAKGREPNSAALWAAGRSATTVS